MDSPHTKSDYVALQELRALPALQVENARYVRRKAKECQMGALSTILKSGEVDITKFSTFIFLTSAVRGPFLPVHIKVSTMRFLYLLKPILQGGLNTVLLSDYRRRVPRPMISF